MRNMHHRAVKQQVRELLEDSIKCLDKEDEGQQSFGIYRLRDNLTKIKKLLYSSQHQSGVDLQGIDDGEPSAYDVGKITLEQKGEQGFIFKTDIDITINADPPPVDMEGFGFGGKPNIDNDPPPMDMEESD